MRPVVTAAEMRALDRTTIEELGLPAIVLMETAGRAVADAARRMAPHGHVAVVCGPGNNGGDGFVAARQPWASAPAISSAQPRIRISSMPSIITRTLLSVPL